MMEIERKFLVKDGWRAEVYASSDIRQGYLCRDARSTVRVRTYGDRAFLTIKGKARPGHFGRFEWEKEISLADADALFSLIPAGSIEKTRHLVRSADGIHTWEIDEFHGANEGLVLAEIELEGEDTPFPRPGWLGEEVTLDPRYYNSYLVANPYRDW
ncbi:MAG: CYTH domain-containing protein [Bacteroidales bacterium]|nr:CYTH domain-containing protein [Bacteroidales bacterium]